MSEQLDREAVLQEVLAFICTPKTVEEVAFEFNWHAQTARTYLWTLQTMGRAKSLARKHARRKLWQATGGPNSQGDVVIRTSTGAVALKDCLSWDDSRVSQTNLLNGALAYLWRRAYYKIQDQEDSRNVAMQGTLDPTLDVRRVMSEVQGLAHTVYELLTQLLVDYPNLWEDGVAPFKIIGTEVDRLAVEEAAAHFEVWASALLGGGVTSPT